MPDLHRIIRVQRHFEIADAFLMDGGVLDKQKFRQLLEEHNDDFGITDDTKSWEKESTRITYIHNAWRKLCKKIKDEAKKRGNISNILLIDENFSKGQSQTISYVIKGYSLLSPKTKQSKREKWERDLDSRIQSVELSDIELDNDDLGFSKLFFGVDYSIFEQKKPVFANKSFALEFDRIKQLEESSETNAVEIFNRYQKLLAKKNISNSNLAACLAQYANFIASNWKTNENLRATASINDWVKEICSSFERAIQLTENDPFLLKENTQYRLRYINYLSFRTNDGNNKSLIQADKVSDYIPSLTNDLFKVDCLLDLGKFYFIGKNFDRAFCMINQAKDILCDLSSKGQNVSAKRFDLHMLCLKIALSDIESPGIYESDEFKAALDSVRLFSPHKLKAKIFDVNFLYDNYEQALRQRGDTDYACSILKQHLKLLMSLYLDDPSSKERYEILYLLNNWSAELHLNNTLKDNFEEYKNILSDIKKHITSFYIDELSEELDILQSVWNIREINRELSYSEHILLADNLCHIANISLLTFSRLTPVVKNFFEEALSIYKKYYDCEIRSLISFIETKLLLLKLLRENELSITTAIEKQYSDLIALIEASGDSPYLKFLLLKSVNCCIKSLNSLNDKNFRCVIPFLEKAFNLHNNLVLNITAAEVDDDKAIDILLFTGKSYKKNDADYDFYFNCAVRYHSDFSSFSHYDFCCSDEILDTYKFTVDFYKIEYHQLNLTDDSLLQKLDLLLDKFSNEDICHRSDRDAFYTLVQHCIMALPDDISRIKMRRNVRRIIVSEDEPQHYLSYLPDNIIQERISTINFYLDSSNIGYRIAALVGLDELAWIYHELGLYRKQKQVCLKILKIVDELKKNNLEYNRLFEIQAIESLYYLYLKSRRYKVALKYLNSLISRYEELRESDSSYHNLVKKFMLEKLDLEDKLYQT